MPTVMTPHRPSHQYVGLRTGPQKICIVGGFGFVFLGLIGVVMPGILGLHLSVMHNLIHIVSGVVALWCGYTTPDRAFNFNLGFGILYALIGIVGFVLGEPGYPSVGHLEADQNLFRVIPNFLELGTIDHTFHILIGGFLLFTAYSFRKDRGINTAKVRK